MLKSSELAGMRSCTRSSSATPKSVFWRMSNCSSVCLSCCKLLASNEDMASTHCLALSASPRKQYAQPSMMSSVTRSGLSKGVSLSARFKMGSASPDWAKSSKACAKGIAT